VRSCVIDNLAIFSCRFQSGKTTSHASSEEREPNFTTFGDDIAQSSRLHAVSDFRYLVPFRKGGG